VRYLALLDTVGTPILTLYLSAGTLPLAPSLPKLGLRASGSMRKDCILRTWFAHMPRWNH
jgi:hypothetical protein